MVSDRLSRYIISTAVFASVASKNVAAYAANIRSLACKQFFCRYCGAIIKLAPQKERVKAYERSVP